MEPRSDPVPAQSVPAAQVEAGDSARAQAPDATDAAQRRPHWRQLLSGSSSREVLARIHPGDPLELRRLAGERLREIVQGCGGAEAAFKLMMLEHLDHLAETASKAIANVKFDKVIVWDGGNGNGGASGFLSGLGRSIPPLMDIMRNLGGVELPDYLGRMVEQPPVADAKSESADDAKPAGTAPSNGG